MTKDSAILIMNSVLSELKMTTNALSKKLGMGRSQSLYDILNPKKENVKISKNLADKITAVFPDFNKSWLLTGEGEMLLAKDSKDDMLMLDAEPQAIINYEQKGIPFYEVDFICGFDVIMNDQTVNPEYYVDFKPYNNADYWVRASGHSMEPAISSGDAIAIKEIHRWRDYLPFGEIYAIITDEFRTIKIISKGSSDNTFSLIPINPDSKYGVQEIPRSFITKVFHVLGSVKQF